MPLPPGCSCCFHLRAAGKQGCMCSGAAGLQSRPGRQIASQPARQLAERSPCTSGRRPLVGAAARRRAPALPALWPGQPLGGRQEGRLAAADRLGAVPAQSVRRGGAGGLELTGWAGGQEAGGPTLYCRSVGACGLAHHVLFLCGHACKFHSRAAAHGLLSRLRIASQQSQGSAPNRTAPFPPT